MGLLETTCGLLQDIRRDNNMCLEQLLPEIIEHNQRMDQLFQWIDKLEVLVAEVKKNVDDMDNQVTRAERLLSKSLSVKRIFSSLFNNNRNERRQSIVSYQEPQLFKAADYFPMNGATKDNHD